MTRERMLADAVEMIEWVRRELGQKKIFVLGHSWGSYLGLQLSATASADLLHAYIGVGQLTDGPESERRGLGVSALSRAAQARTGIGGRFRNWRRLRRTSRRGGRLRSKILTRSGGGWTSMAGLWCAAGVIRMRAIWRICLRIIRTQRWRVCGRGMIFQRSICCRVS